MVIILSKKKSIFILCIILILNMSLFKTSNAESLNSNVVKVGVFALEPYVYRDEKGNIKGYYIDFFNLIAKKMNIKVEYILEDIEDWLPELENKEVDILLGASITEERSKKYIFNKNPIALEKFDLYTNKNELDLSDFQNLNGLTYGYVSESATAYWMFNFFKAIGVEVNSIILNDYSKLEEFMKNGKIDLMIDSSYSLNKFKKIYEFSGDQVYIAANKENKSLLDEIDSVIEEYTSTSNNELDKLYKIYFDEQQKDFYKKLNLIIVVSIISILICLNLYIIPKLNVLKTRFKIRKRLKEDKYLLYYQPIYNPIKKSITGFEGLLRLKDKDNNLISPAEFIPEIENNNMLFEVTLWIISKVIYDYNKISTYNLVKNSDFYISINLSIDEIINDKFVNKAIDLLKKSNLPQNSICLEIIERVGIKDLPKINKNITKLKNAGFKIAIDDFGIEYSNLDVLEKLDADIIKVDKEYVDGLGKDLIKDETVRFIIKVANVEGKKVVLEGVEEEEQDNIIKRINKNNLFVQGYFYNRPMSIENIKYL